MSAPSPEPPAPEPPAPEPPAGEPPAAEAAVRAVDLHKTYTGPRGDVPAVRGVDLAVAPGEFFGLLGPNGAGKSTTIGMLTTLVVPTSGQARVCGLDVTRDAVAVKRRIGMVSQNNTLDNELTAVENLEFRGRYFGLGAKDARRRADELLEMFNLTDRRTGTPFELSGGQAKRLMICRALVHRPEVLFLDEPTAGLDPQTRVNLWEVLRELQAGGQTTLLTTHYMEEAEALCDRVAVVDHGRVLASGTVPELKSSAGADTVITVTYDGDVPEGVRKLSEREGIGKVEVTGAQVRVFARSPDGLLAELVAAGAAAGVGVTDASQLRPSLETVFLTLTGRDYRE
ncbi:ABC transporter ATP-binding protein [Actinomadura macrotermitis]|uniref:Daunorubicin/doxorubicin resistance ATP-binding protein DrrA n=1 Tax=Actinomadura macrotermitis TaxID=2585200 RepID=A0A7K0C8L0_9ACTN|nr:ABC transporter ATP-binding protein [Actinomadura macrotermitis]MQY09811.1 Daunorubicin/doxorubicin resistance ATP-binding protein DrrA [Actinomadura macrotermitis]